MADWSQLPYDLISMIANRIPTIEDFLALSSVCHSWRSVYTNKNWSPCPHFPWLMLSESKHNQPTRAFFSFYKNKRHLVPLPESQGRRCWGSSCGWIFTIGLDLQMHLLNPVTRIRIDLPPHSTFSQEFTLELAATLDWYRTHFVHKAFVFKMSKRKGDILVMVIHGKNCCLAFARPGFSSWVTVESSTPCVFKDVTVFDGRIFALCDSGALLVVEDIADGPSSAASVRQVASPPNGAMDWEKMYLVESFGELLLLCRRLARSIIDFSLQTVSFEVYKYDFNGQEWIELEELGDRALFIGDNHSMSLSSSEDVSCKANSIYFADDNPGRWPASEEDHGKCDTGVYKMADRSIQSLDFDEDFTLNYPCPIWVMPALS